MGYLGVDCWRYEFLLDSNMIAPPLSLTIQTDHKFKCYNIVGDKHTDLVDDRNVLHRNGRIIQNILRLDFKFFLLLCMTNVNWCEDYVFFSGALG